MSKTSQIVVRVDPELRARLEKLAEKENRALSQKVHLMLERQCDLEERRAKK